ncbi:hypothetical protein QA612_16525 [Evansella sp. AB-P1]|uniref:hypothetical protein n=1 Tax=Evansella sp. AB-P1 TaxID=3037653 RepID=UPI00241D8547|nr:hypothetical protein [Evansella sp. AB-P1]MDG5789064.1 hypothetical protein [Evansella sp. AB-P1]
MDWCKECGQLKGIIVHFFDNGLDCTYCGAWLCPSCAMTIPTEDDHCRCMDD